MLKKRKIRYIAKSTKCHVGKLIISEYIYE